jgi:hypothetical protein
MKLFITNKEDFDKDFPSSQKEVHRIAYNKLLKEIGIKREPPEKFTFDYDLWFVEFNFINEVNSVYFYSYERW